MSISDQLRQILGEVQHLKMIKIKIKGSKEVIENLNSALAKLSDTREVLSGVQSYLLGEIEINFASQGAHFGEPWAELSPMTKEIKRQRGFGGAPPLVRTGRMRASFKGFLGTDATAGVGMLMIANPTPYFIKHQSAIDMDRLIYPMWKIGGKEFLSPKGATILPRRVMIKLTKAQINSIANSFQRWIVDTIKPS